jgi:hypothetical protein
MAIAILCCVIKKLVLLSHKKNREHQMCNVEVCNNFNDYCLDDIVSIVTIEEKCLQYYDITILDLKNQQEIAISKTNLDQETSSSDQEILSVSSTTVPVYM